MSINFVVFTTLLCVFVSLDLHTIKPQVADKVVLRGPQGLTLIIGINLLAISLGLAIHLLPPPVQAHHSLQAKRATTTVQIRYIFLTLLMSELFLCMMFQHGYHYFLSPAA